MLAQVKNDQPDNAVAGILIKQNQKSGETASGSNFSTILNEQVSASEKRQPDKAELKEDDRQKPSVNTADERIKPEEKRASAEIKNEHPEINSKINDTGKNDIEPDKNEKNT